MVLSTALLILYALFFLLNTAAEGFSFRKKTRSLSTPLLMPLLIIWILSTGARPWLLIVGLLGATLGDILLMYPENRNRKFFLFGIFSFTLTHVVYIVYFLRLWERVSIPVYFWVAAFFLSAATLTLFLRINKNLKKLTFPVAAYSLLLLVTAIIILFSYSYLSLNQYIRALAGILLFLISDAALSQDWFIQEFRTARPIAMGTYIIAQFLLVSVVIEL